MDFKKHLINSVLLDFIEYVETLSKSNVFWYHCQRGVCRKNACV